MSAGMTEVRPETMAFLTAAAEIAKASHLSSEAAHAWLMYLAPPHEFDNGYALRSVIVQLLSDRSSAEKTDAERGDR